MLNNILAGAVACVLFILSPGILQSQTDANTQIKGICIYIDYPNAPANVTAIELDSIFNDMDYQSTGIERSFRKYWYDESRRNLDITHDTFFYTAPQPSTYYDTLSNQDGIMLWRDALEWVVTNHPTYDWSSISIYSSSEPVVPSKVSTVKSAMIISSIDGPIGLNATHEPNWILSNGIQIGSIYGAPLQNATDPNINVNSLLHQSGQAIFGFPETYDSDSSSSGTSAYSLMSSFDAPIGAPFLDQQNWGHIVEPTVGAHTITLRADGDSIVVLRNVHDPHEFFSLEVRKNTTVGNSQFPAPLGLLIWHSDLKVGTNNTLENATRYSHYKHSIIQKDGLLELESGPNIAPNIGDVYLPGDTLNDTSTPNAHWWAGEESGIEIKDIILLDSTHIQFTVLLDEVHEDHYGFIPKDNWTLVSATPSQAGYGGEKAFDNDPGSYYHVPDQNPYARPHELVIDFGAEYEINEFYYTANNNYSPPLEGRVKDFELHFSQDGINWGSPIVTESFFETGIRQYELLSDTIAKYVKFSAVNGYDTGNRTSVAELDFRGNLALANYYCDAQGDVATGADWIKNISVNAIDNSSSQSQYSNFTHLSTTLVQDSTYVIEMEGNQAFPIDSAFTWIDWNQNQMFDSVEHIVMSSFDTLNVSTGTFTVPSNALLDTTLLRTRIIADSIQIADPCNTYEGEVEDYLIIVADCDDLKSLSAFPMDLQLYARDTVSNKASILIEGQVNTIGDSVSVVILREGLPYSQHGYKTTTLNFILTPDIDAELANYTIQLYIISQSCSKLYREAKDVVAGDVFIITGQSNAVARQHARSSANYINDFVRVFSNINPINADAWYIGQGDGNQLTLGNTGQWGLVMANVLISSTNIPISIFNGGQGRTSIAAHQRNDNNPANLNTLYGVLLHRLTFTGLANSVRGVLWYQGETDGRKTQDFYETAFDGLFQSWKTDYPNTEQFYAIQTRSGCGGGPQEMINIQEAIRNQCAEKADLTMMTTKGIATDGCHYPFVDGYEKLGMRIANLLLNDLYNGINPDVDAPEILSADFMGSDPLKLELSISGADNLYIDPNALSEFDIPNNSILSATVAARNKLILNLASPLTGSSILTYYDSTPTTSTDYIKDTQGIGLASFKNFPINGHYCVPKVIAPMDGDWIKNVSINTINNTSGKSEYSDFTSMPTTLLIDSTYLLKIEVDTVLPIDSTYAWIDWNLDYAFNSNEQIIMSALDSNNISTATITIPSNSILDSIRLRTMIISSLNQIPNPCKIFDGEVEDYLLVIDCIDSDNDGVCENDDVCPGLDDTLIGIGCDDGDICTINDVYDSNCLCVGNFKDSDLDGVCDINDQCQGFDDTIDMDFDGIPDGCDVDFIPVSNCDTLMHLTGIEALYYHRAMDTIFSIQLIDGYEVRYSAGSEIQLNQTFEIKLGTVFHGFIEACN